MQWSRPFIDVLFMAGQAVAGFCMAYGAYLAWKYKAVPQNPGPHAGVLNQLPWPRPERSGGRRPGEKPQTGAEAAAISGPDPSDTHLPVLSRSL